MRIALMKAGLCSTLEKVEEVLYHNKKMNVPCRFWTVPTLLGMKYDLFLPPECI